jgi:RNA polymerase sigma factor (sigma-70 family)
MEEKEHPANEPSDEEILKRLTENFTEGFELLVKKYTPQLRAAAARSVGYDTAEDVTQETMKNAYQALSHYSHERILALRLRNYLYTVAVNICRHPPYRQTRSEEPLYESIFSALKADQKEEPEEVFARKQDSEALARAINRLPPIYREVIVLHYFKELKLTEIAQQLHVPLSTVKIRHRRAKKLLAILYRQEMQDDKEV